MSYLQSCERCKKTVQYPYFDKNKNIIKIQSNDIPLIAIDKYLSQPRKLHLKNHLKTDSLSYNYEVLEK